MKDGKHIAYFTGQQIQNFTWRTSKITLLSWPRSFEMLETFQNTIHWRIHSMH